MSPTAAAPRLTLAEAVELTHVAMDACNLSGLAHDFPRVMQAVWDDVNARNGGTREANTHPLTVLWVQKMAELAELPIGVDSEDGLHEAFAWLRSQRAARA